MISTIFDRLRRLTWRDAVGMTEAALLLCRVALGLRRKAFPDLLRRLRVNERMPLAEAGLVDQASRHVRWAHRIVPLEPNCLLDSLATAALVRRKGFSVPLVIGVQRERGTLQAHAWLGISSAAEQENFRPLYRVPAEE